MFHLIFSFTLSSEDHVPIPALWLHQRPAEHPEPLEEHLCPAGSSSRLQKARGCCRGSGRAPREGAESPLPGWGQRQKKHLYPHSKTTLAQSSSSSSSGEEAGSKFLRENVIKIQLLSCVFHGAPGLCHVPRNTFFQDNGSILWQGKEGFHPRREPLEGDMTPILGGGSPGIQAAAPASRLPWKRDAPGLSSFSPSGEGCGVLSELLGYPWDARAAPGGDGCWQGQLPPDLGTWQLQILPPGKP